MFQKPLIPLHSQRAIVCGLWLLLASACAGAIPRSVPQGPEVLIGDHEPPLALRRTSLKFAVIGDSGQWSSVQRETAAQLAAQRTTTPFDAVLMLGDNNYGDGSAESYRVRFEEPFKPLLDAGVTFYAVRGNHDVGAQWKYPRFNMGGERYYTLERRAGVIPALGGDRVQFFALDSVNLDRQQLSWFDRQLSESTADWKVVFFHHPIYSTGRYARSSAARRSAIERVLIEHGVDVVFSGHEHLYERLVPQNGVMYFVVGASGSVRVGDLRPSAFRAAGYDRDLSFLLVEILGDALYFRAVNRVGETIDRGKILKTPSSP